MGGLFDFFISERSGRKFFFDSVVIFVVLSLYRLSVLSACIILCIIHDLTSFMSLSTNLIYSPEYKI